MRRPEYLSPTSLALFRKNKEQFYVRYLCETRLPRDAQTQPMAVGSAFDALIKAHLYKTLVGKVNPMFDEVRLFETQVEPGNRIRAWDDGRHVFEFYRSCGALAELLIEMKDCLGEPRFEIEVKGTLAHKGRSVPFLGKPDVFFMNPAGGHIILDWKVNGYYSNYPQSPHKGYLRIFPGLYQHNDCVQCDHFGMKVNKLYTLDMMNEDWAAQLSIYAWLCGVDIGSEFIAGIDQIVCDRKKSIPPVLRVAQHRTLIDKDFQNKLFDEAADCWEVINSDYVFRDMTMADSKARCKMLDDQVEMLKAQSGEDDDNFMKLVRSHHMY